MRLTLDTNVLAYAEGVGDARRCFLARELIAGLPIEKVLIPVQVLGELHRVLIGKAGRTAEQSKEDLLGLSEDMPTVYPSSGRTV